MVVALQCTHVTLVSHQVADDVIPVCMRYYGFMKTMDRLFRRDGEVAPSRNSGPGWKDEERGDLAEKSTLGSFQQTNQVSVLCAIESNYHERA